MEEFIRSLSDMSLKDVEARLSSLDVEVRSMTDVAKIDEATEQKKALLERKRELEDLEKKKQAVADLTSGAATGTIIERGGIMPVNTMSEEALYRSAWLKQVRGLELNDVEKRAFSTSSSSAGAVVPTTTANKIIDKVKQYAPLLTKIELLGIKGNITIPAEGTTTDAQLHTEGGTITGDSDTLGKVSLSGYEITKLVTISKSVETMSTDMFEDWLTNKIAKKVSDKINALIINGTGSNQPEGINAITWSATNSVTVAKAANLAEGNVTGVVALLGGGYLANSEWFMSSTTFFSDFHPLMNNSKNNVVTESNGVYRVMGRPVTFDDRVTLHEAILGDIYSGYIGNLQEDVTITSQFVTRENSYDFLGCAIFDGKVQATEAFVKIVKATA